VVDSGRVESGEFVPDRPDQAQRAVVVSTKLVQPGATAMPSPHPLAERENEVHGSTVLLDARLSYEALAFCQARGVVSELYLAIETARNCFPVIGNPDVELVHDPETEDASYLVIAIKVQGEVKDIVMAHRKFANETARLLGPSRAIIALNYDII
jgi:hypothetical protein